MGYISGVWNRKKNKRNSVSSEGTHYRLRAERRPAKHEESKVHNFDGHVRLVESHPIFHNNANDQTIAPILVLPLIRAVHRPLLPPSASPIVILCRFLVLSPPPHCFRKVGPSSVGPL